MAKVRITKSELKKLAKRLKKDIIREATPKLSVALKDEIINKNILKGRSPVAGAGRYKKYSKNYVQQMKGKLAFRTAKNGKVYAIDPKKAKGKNAKKGIKDKIEDLNSYLIGFGKQPRPVNFKVSGKGINSFRIYRTVRGVKIEFTDKKASWFQDGDIKQNRPPRPLLPKRGQVFNTGIRKRIDKVMALVMKKLLKTDKA